jgi:hypothetical protein
MKIIVIKGLREERVRKGCTVLYYALHNSHSPVPQYSALF